MFLVLPRSKGLPLQAIAESEKALLEGEARLADWEAKVSSNNSCLYQLKHDALPEAGQRSEKVTADRILRHLEHMIDAKGAAVESFTIQAATLKVGVLIQSCKTDTTDCCPH